jgi:hypothetical protein
MMTEIMTRLVVPTRNPFKGIYIVGHFTTNRIAMAALEVRQLA